MSHAALTNDGLLCLTLLAAVLLVAFVATALQAPRQSASPPRHTVRESPEQALPPRPDHDDPATGRPRLAATWPPEGAARSAADGSCMAKHTALTAGGPPWGPAPKPSDVDQ
jgi:hypothetical protein